MSKENLQHQLDALKFQNLQLTASLNLLSVLGKSYDHMLKTDITIPQKSLILTMQEVHETAFSNDVVKNAISEYNKNRPKDE
jgi:hypothetical protein